MGLTREEVVRRLTAIFCDVFEDEDLTIYDAMTAEDIEEWDSLNHVTLMVSAEREFGLRLTAAEVGELESVGQLIRLIEARATK